jgi:threonine efflux protein
MDYLVVFIGVFAVFIPALLLPGPDFVAVVRSSMTRGSKAGLATTAGVSMGLCLYASLSLLGLSAILVQYQWLTWTVRILGGAYLIYLGIRLLMSNAKAVDVEPRDAPRRSALLFGFLVTLTNPKAIVLFASVFATAVTAATPLWVMVLMIVLVTASSLIWYSLVSLFMSSAPVMRRFQNARHRIEKAAGACFVAIGVKVMADARSPVSA